MRERLTQLEAARARVWTLDERNRIETSDLEERLEVLNRKRLEVQAAIIKLLEERALIIASRERDQEVEATFREMHGHFERAADNFERARLARAFAAAAGGIVVTKGLRLELGSRLSSVSTRFSKRADCTGLP